MSEQLTPRQIVHELDRYIVGQNEAKKAVAIALRNRYRRSRVDESLRDEIIPKNILMVGPTGVGKTEIARRLARLGEPRSPPRSLGAARLCGGGDTQSGQRSSPQGANSAFTPRLCGIWGV